MIRFLLSICGLFFSVSAVAQMPLLPDLVTEAYFLRDLQVDRSTIPGRRLLRFSNSVANVGDGVLELRGGQVTGSTREVWQRIYNSDRSYSQRLVGNFVYHPSHKHMHFEDFVDYYLRQRGADNSVGAIVAESRKVSFCVRDTQVANSSLPGFTWPPYFLSCTANVQGITVGWRDVYNKRLPEQWIDITGIPPGRYWLESRADRNNRLVEINENNNLTRVAIILQ